MKKSAQTLPKHHQALKLGEIVLSVENKPPAEKRRYQIYEVDSPHGGFTMYCAGEGQAGGGQLVFDEQGVSVLLKPESAWRPATKANRKASNKLKDTEGNWSIWFLLARVLVLNKRALAACELGMGPADTLEEAASQMLKMNKAMKLASDARIHALPHVDFLEIEETLEIARSQQSFTQWFGSILADKLAAGDFEFVDSITGFVRAVHGLPENGYPDDVLMFRKVLAEQAGLAGGPPTKLSLRLALGVEEAKMNGETKGEDSVKSSDVEEVSIWANRADSPTFEIPDHSKMGGVNDTFDENILKRLLERTGFGWLPNGKTGPKRKSKVGSGRSEPLMELYSTGEGRRKPNQGVS